MPETNNPLIGAQSAADPTAANPSAGADWSSGFDESTREYVGKKGWGSASDVLTSYQNLEKLQGGAKNVIEMPGVDATDEAKSAFYNKLGRPATVDEYSMEMPDGGDSDFFNWFKTTSHSQGLSDAQAKGLLEAYNTMSGERMGNYQVAQAEQSEKELNELKTQWGQDYDKRVDEGKRAAGVLNYDEEALSALESKMGTAEMVKLFADIGSRMSEDSFASADRGGDGSFTINPGQAKQEILELKSNKEFMDKYLAGDKGAMAKMTRLNKIAHDKR